jgi:pSer/pThr/pTyr-binding forkhead associated (FHA) protein
MIDDAAITLEDLGSRNGTFVNDDRIDGVRRLVDGDEIRVGPARLILHAGRSAATLTDRSER